MMTRLELRLVSKVSASRVLNDVHLGRDSHCDGWDDESLWRGIEGDAARGQCGERCVDFCAGSLSGAAAKGHLPRAAVCSALAQFNYSCSRAVQRLLRTRSRTRRGSKREMTKRWFVAN